MTKQDFLLSLQSRLSRLPQDEVNGRLNFYNEMIEDRIEEGFSEEDAVSAIGSIDEIVAQIVADIPLTRIAKDKIKPKRRPKVWEITLLILGFPLWFPLIIAAFAVIFSLYISLWSVIISLWAVFVSVFACALCGIALGAGFALKVNTPSGTAMIGAGIASLGIAILLFYISKAATKGILILTKKVVMWIKNFFIKKEAA